MRGVGHDGRKVLVCDSLWLFRIAPCVRLHVRSVDTEMLCFWGPDRGPGLRRAKRSWANDPSRETRDLTNTGHLVGV